MSAAAAIQFCDYHPDDSDFKRDVLDGLGAQPKAIAPKYFYDQHGSELFDAICELPEYYLTRTEVGLLQGHAREIASLAGPNCLLIELGSGASKKVRVLLEALYPSAYVGVDISKEFLLHSTLRLAADYPWLEVHAACADFSQGLDLPASPGAANKLAFFPGSSIGNFEPREAETFLKDVGKHLRPNDAMLLGIDLKKDPAVLHAAYNDDASVTARFNLNLLTRIKRELGSDLEPENFEHRALYDESKGRVEMHLVSRRAQQVSIAGQTFAFAEGESIHTENSYKYTVAEFQSLASRAGYSPERVWTDADEYFSVHYLRFGRR